MKAKGTLFNNLIDMKTVYQRGGRIEKSKPEVSCVFGPRENWAYLIQLW